MWTHHFEQITDLPIQQLWTVLANVRGWIDIDQNIEALKIEQEPGRGIQFELKPKGAPKLKFTIEIFEPPISYADTCKMPGAQMKTLHTLELLNDGKVKINVDIEIKGPLSWLWGATVGKTHAGGLPRQTEIFIEAARKLTHQ